MSNANLVDDPQLGVSLLSIWEEQGLRGLVRGHLLVGQGRGWGWGRDCEHGEDEDPQGRGKE